MKKGYISAVLIFGLTINSAWAENPDIQTNYYCSSKEVMLKDKTDNSFKIENNFDHCKIGDLLLMTSINLETMKYCDFRYQVELVGRSGVCIKGNFKREERVVN